jgi:hypothetical protein
MDDSILQPAEQVDALLAIGYARVFSGDDGSIENRLTALKIHSVVVEIGSSLPLVPCDHHSKL